MSRIIPAIPPTERRALTVNEWCAAYGPSRSSLYKMISKGEIKTIVIAGRRLVAVDEAEKLLESGGAR